MSVNKRFLIQIIILAIICISVFTIVLDFSRLFGSSILYVAYPNHIIKRINVVLAALLVWLAGKDSLNLNKQDNTKMKFVFIAIGCGEVSFLLAKPALAIGFFTVCQCLLIIRHCKGLRVKLIKASCPRKLKLALLLLILMSMPVFVIIILYPMVKLDSTIFMGIAYSFVLSISLWSALTNHILALFPYKNSKMIAIGMLCFYLCDISVGLDGLLWSGTAWLLATSLTWVFYTPAITLLALSCYRYEVGLPTTQKKLKSF
ncbi:MAG TPA: hypothetical protein VEF53_07050 [Patescibacteria group bacterium]|nr:hypothetical protein [Patescibacteria group bacterium]